MKGIVSFIVIFGLIAIIVFIFFYLQNFRKEEGFAEIIEFYSNNVISFETFSVYDREPTEKYPTLIAFILANNGRREVNNLSVIFTNLGFFDVANIAEVFNKSSCKDFYEVEISSNLIKNYEFLPTCEPSQICKIIYYCNPKTLEFKVDKMDRFQRLSISVFLNSSDIGDWPKKNPIDILVKYKVKNERSAFVPVIDGITVKNYEETLKQTEHFFGPIEASFAMDPEFATNNRPFDLEINLRDISQNPEKVISTVISNLTIMFDENFGLGEENCDKLKKASKNIFILKSNFTVPFSIRCSGIIYKDENEAFGFKVAEVNITYSYTYEFLKRVDFTIFPLP